MPIFQKIHNLLVRNNSSLHFLEIIVWFVICFIFDHKLKMYGVIDRKHQILFDNSSRFTARVLNQVISKLNCARLPNCVPSLASRLPGKNHNAVSNICPRVGSGVSA